MIIGRGLLASVFDPGLIYSAGAVVFASGVSNSKESRPDAFERERRLLAEALSRENGRLVYFSTCSVADTHRATTPYVQHKLAMEAMVRHRPDSMVLRLPQVVGKTDNPHTLTNFLASRIRTGQPFEVWRDAKRCLIDAESVGAMTTHLLIDGPCPTTPVDLAPDEVITMVELVSMMESILCKKASFRVVEQGGGVRPDPSFAASLAPRVGADLRPGHALRTLRKYFSTSNEH